MQQLRTPSSSAPDSPGRSAEQEWAERLRAVSVSKATMDRLVMNWLVIEGHQEAAQRFEAESGTDAGVDLETVSDRMSIRAAIQSGDVRQAVERVEALDGAILSSNPELSFKLKQQQLVELIREGPIEGALAFAQAELAPLAEDNPAFLDDLERTMLLLAYEDASQAPTASLLSQATRQKTASQLNAAILSAQKQEQAPMLPMMLKMLQWAQLELQQRQQQPFPQIDDLVEAVPRLLVTDQPSATHSET